jgi:hypothetical protein
MTNGFRLVFSEPSGAIHKANLSDIMQDKTRKRYYVLQDKEYEQTGKMSVSFASRCNAQ